MGIKGDEASPKSCADFGLTGESDLSRRTFLKSTGILGVGIASGLPRAVEAQARGEAAGSTPQTIAVTLQVNGERHALVVDTRTTLLDALRDRLSLTGTKLTGTKLTGTKLTGTKKGCDHGQCGACTVLLDGRRVNSCLTLVAACEGAQVVSVEGLAQGEALSPVQAAFLEHDAFQCGFCTPGQICSATALLEEVRQGRLSIVSYQTGETTAPLLSEDEIRERMSGNLCRCGAYPRIVAAVRAAASKQGVGGAL